MIYVLILTILSIVSLLPIPKNLIITYFWVIVNGSVIYLLAFTISLKVLPTLIATAFDAGITIFSLVFGLTPLRSERMTFVIPKMPVILISLPLATSDIIVSKKELMIVSVSVFELSVDLATSATKSDFDSVFIR